MLDRGRLKIGHIDQCIYILSPNKSHEGRKNFVAYSPSNLDVGILLGLDSHDHPIARSLGCLDFRAPPKSLHVCHSQDASHTQATDS